MKPHCPSEMFICFLILSGITISESEGYELVRVADPVFAVVGGDAILPCSIKPNITIVDMKVEWVRLDQEHSVVVHLYEDHEDRIAEQIQSYRGRTELNPQELQRGNAALKLISVQESDEGVYKCFIHSTSWSIDTNINVKVEAVGSPPVITVDGFNSGGLNLQCESEGWYPEPDLEWLDGKRTRLNPETTETHRNRDGFSVKQTISVGHKDGKIHCRVKLRDHLLETQIVISCNMFKSSKISFIVIAVACIGISIWIIYKYIAHRKLQSQIKIQDGELIHKIENPV
uniref:uncharacterized protein LOC100141489 precursor n=1 Tax=Danio rerio TaxID=7955 RepID=UPI0000F6CB30|nr:uncharacterized protein LOC100141489 precursor [Danio rerio]CAM73258.1 unnamed protein product [Danio rerio]